MAYYQSEAHSAFWDTHWQTYGRADSYVAAQRGKLGPFEKPFASYLPRQGRILEAGCGLGKYVLALRARGYDAEGVEWGPRTVEAVRAQYPDLPIRVADVTRLEVPDAYYSGYISLGVVEHRQEGPEPFLEEAYRVLRSGGVALISVPYFHPLRRLKACLGQFRGDPGGLEFYQYAFTETEFTSFLRAAGFRTVDRMVYNGLKGLKDEIAFLRLMLRLRGVNWRLKRLLQRWRYAETRFGHMILMVCRKE